jgi:hypothetical protein
MVAGVQRVLVTGRERGQQIQYLAFVAEPTSRRDSAAEGEPVIVSRIGRK